MLIRHTFFEPVGMEHMWDDLSLASLLAYKPEILKKYKELLYQLDLQRKEITKSLLLYSEIELNQGYQKYLKIKMSLVNVSTK